MIVRIGLLMFSELYKDQSVLMNESNVPLLVDSTKATVVS